MEESKNVDLNNWRKRQLVAWAIGKQKVAAFSNSSAEEDNKKDVIIAPFRGAVKDDAGRELMLFDIVTAAARSSSTDPTDHNN